MDINNENSNKKRLGRGLGSLLSGATAAIEGAPARSVAEQAVRAGAGAAHVVVAPVSPTAVAVEVANRVWQTPIDKLVPGVYQPRKNFDRLALQELADSIKQNGIIQPITVRRRESGGFEIIAGERRWRAAQLAGLHEVPTIIKNLSDRESLQIAIIENMQREDLDPIEEADGYQRLVEEFKLTQIEVAEKVGKERSTVANSLRLLSLPADIREMVSQKQISVGHAKVLLGVADKSKQSLLAKKIIQKNLSVRALENEAKEKASFEKQENTNQTVSVSTQLAKEMANQIQKKLGTKVEIAYNDGRGQLTIHFYTNEQLNQINEKLST